MTEDEDWLRKDYNWRADARAAAGAIQHWITSINAVPAYDINRDRIESYYINLDEACKEMKAILERYRDE